MEYNLLTFLYLDLWVNKKPVDLYFLIDSAKENERLYPCPIEDKTVKLDKVMINGQNFSDFNREKTYVNLPAAGKIKMKVTLSR